jgi:hypothetical protein
MASPLESSLIRDQLLENAKILLTSPASNADNTLNTHISTKGQQEDANENDEHVGGGTHIPRHFDLGGTRVCRPSYAFGSIPRSRR